MHVFNILQFVVLTTLAAGRVSCFDSKQLPLSYGQAHNVGITVPFSGSSQIPDTFNVTTMHLSSVENSNNFMVLAHPRFPNHQVRIKKSDFCDPTVK